MALCDMAVRGAEDRPRGSASIVQLGSGDLWNGSSVLRVRSFNAWIDLIRNRLRNTA